MAETIYALSSAYGKAGVAVFRLSGPGTAKALEKLAGKCPPPRVVSRETFHDPATGEVLDEGLALYFAAPKSFTGEDVVELHTHGSIAVITGMLAALSTLPGLRLAEPGEFSKRAFDNGKMDLTAAEGLADLIEAETAEQRKAALSQMGGALADLYDGWRSRLLHLLAYAEAELEFPDEELGRDLLAEIRPKVAALAAEIRGHLADNRRGERLRDGVRVAVIGPPNAGKSSLINHLARRDVAIVTDIAGTTRDVLEVHLDLGGFPVILADTAGLRETQDIVEQEGVRRALKWAESADLVLYLADSTAWPPADPEQAKAAADLLVLNKSDLSQAGNPPAGALAISVHQETGIEALLAALTGKVRELVGQRDHAAPVLTRARHREALQHTLNCLERSQTAPLMELAAEDLRLATRELGRITGRVDVEDLLDVIFRDFCIGK